MIIFLDKRTNVKNPDLNPIDTFSNFDDEDDENWDNKSEAKVEIEHHPQIRFQHENHKKLEAQSLDTRFVYFQSRNTNENFEFRMIIILNVEFQNSKLGKPNCGVQNAGRG